MLTTADKRAAFRKLHESGCFIIPNPFDVGSAKALQHLGFKALASTSAGFAWTIGKADNRVTVDDVCDHLAAICAAVDIPVNADFEDGFAHEPDKVGANVARAVKTGVAGLSIEDSTGDNAKPLFDRALAVDRIKAARKAIDADNSGVLLTGRCEAFLRGREGSEARDRPAHGLCRSRRRLPLCARHQDGGGDFGRGEGGASKARQSPGRRGRPVAEGCRRSRRPPHQRRRRAGADGVDRLHEGLKGDGRAGDVHASSPTAIPAANSTRCSGKAQKKTQRAHCPLRCCISQSQPLLLAGRRVSAGGVAVHVRARRGASPGAPAPRPWSCRARCCCGALRHACPEALRGWPAASAARSGWAAWCRPGSRWCCSGHRTRRPAPRRWRPRTSRPWRRWRGLRRVRDRPADLIVETVQPRLTADFVFAQARAIGIVRIELVAMARFLLLVP